MILRAGKYSDVRASGRRATTTGQDARATTNILVPSAATRRILLRDWWWKETREGGFLKEYVRREKGLMSQRLRSVARLMATFKQNNKSDFRLVASVPGRLYQRLKAEDPDFFSDNQNLKNLRRDNPDAVVKL